MRLRIAMRRAGQAWLMIAATAGMANAAPDAPPAAASGGGWTREGWSDDMVAPVAPSSDKVAPVDRATEGREGAAPSLPYVYSIPAGGGAPAPATGATDVQGAATRPADPPRPAARTGGWTREGWSDDVAATVTPPASAIALPGVQGVIPPPAPRRIAPTSRRLAWDGGRGAAFAYERGQRLPTLFIEQPYRVDDWIGYGLPAPPAGARWIRYFDDAVMIDETARVLEAVPGIDWATPPAIYGPTPRIIDATTGEARPARTDGGTTTTEIRSTPGGGKVMITTTTTPEVATTVVEEHEAR